MSARRSRNDVEACIKKNPNPFSGRYEGISDYLRLELNVDLDEIDEFSRVLRVISGTITTRAEIKSSSGKSMLAYFRDVARTVNVVEHGNGSEQRVSSKLKIVSSDGVRLAGNLELTITRDDGDWKGRADIVIGSLRTSFGNVCRKSRFFREVCIDIDYTDELLWPTVDTSFFKSGKKARHVDASTAFKDAGLKLNFDKTKCEKVEDPTPFSPWSRSDMYEAMMKYFDETEDSDDNIWCLMGTTPPDKRYLGFSFDTNGRHGFGLFIKHKSFSGYDSDDKTVSFRANRRLLHYLVHECGHCLGLEHPFDKGDVDSLSWMNYSWKYDELHTPGSYYDSFRYSFSDAELFELRHCPAKMFRDTASSDVMAMTSPDALKSDIPDLVTPTDDTRAKGDDLGELSIGAETTRKVALDLKFRSNTVELGNEVSFEARLKNIGKLPTLVEGDLSLGGRSLKIYVTDPNGLTQNVKPLVEPVHSGYTRPIVLFSADGKEGIDRYSETVRIGMSKSGLVFREPGRYTLRAIYNGSRHHISSDTYDVIVVKGEDEDYDEDSSIQVSTAISLGDAGYSRFAKVRALSKRLTERAVEKKREKIATFVGLAGSLAADHSRQQVYAGSKRSRTGQKVNVVKIDAAQSPLDTLNETNDLVTYFHSKGTKADNLDYSELVISRCKLYLMSKLSEKAEIEFNQMLSDLLLRGVKHEVLQRLSKTWQKMKYPRNPEDKYSPKSLQKRVEEILKWAPKRHGNGETDLSGIGLGRPFNNFQEEDIRKGAKIIEMLFDKQEETKDLNAVLSFADKLQKSQEVNHLVLHWALEAFIVLSDDAKKAGIKYPEPEKMDESMTSRAAMVVLTERVGQPTEAWMNYWRCDADFNHHHRHWHIVYVVGNFVRGVSRSSPVFANAPSHLERQGELFGYMHLQMLARYDAERESWGLGPVEEWNYRDLAVGFNAGFEFHSDEQYRLYVPRPDARWPPEAIRQFQRREGTYRDALDSGVVFGSVEMTPNWSGHILEASSRLYADIYGSIHNSGHGVFGSTGIPPNATSYMNDTATACRDPIFFRWHKRIDDLWQANNNYYRSELDQGAPPITITSTDVLISTDSSPPANFDVWRGRWVNNPPGGVATINTTLGPPIKKFEWDNKISHDNFFYHIRLRRSPGTSISNVLRLTFRIFIVPKNRELERRKYIEMDKFVYSMPAGVDHATLTRSDRQSSVIKREHSNDTSDPERNFATESPGFCECGWPMHMLLPRGTSNGQPYSLVVVVTDNEVDSIGIRTSCGSMSFCGARGQAYPDSRNMGFPFSNPITLNEAIVSIPDAIDRIPNGCRITFMIKNNIPEPNTTPTEEEIWWPFMRLSPTSGNLSNSPTESTPSSWRGRFRVLVDADDAKPNTARQIKLRIQGRGSGNGQYTMRDVRIGRRLGMTIDVRSNTTVLYEGRFLFTVPEGGLVTDPVEFSMDPALGDCFVTFTLDSPGVYMSANSRSRTTLSYRIRDASTVRPDEARWSNLRISNRSANMYCLAGIISEA